ncbi:hypothetical protein DXG01_001556 [Tephrocybe rancida]|nr:hypothetical protein DXG01_001556 [Tephrocybe rancida]
MGVYEPAAEVVSLIQLATEKGFMENKRGERGLRVGIGIRWIHRYAGRHGHPINPELASIFIRMAQLFRIPIVPHFVFDGEDGPAKRRQKKVEGDSHYLVKDLKAMIACFGFSWSQAPGEAEAELAWLSREGVVDAVMTDDSDVFAFGAVNVFRLNSDNKSGVLYSDQSLANCSLDWDRAILIVLLIGGDYSDGLPGCNIETATRLAQAGYGRTLVSAVNADMAESDLQTFLRGWRKDIAAEVISSPLLQAQPNVAHALEKSNFPDFKALNHYLRSSTSERRGAYPPISFDDPDLPGLAKFASQQFTWGATAVQLIDKFSKTIFPGMAVRELMKAAISLDRDPTKRLSTSQLLSTATVVASRTGGHFPETKMELEVTSDVLHRTCTDTKRRYTEGLDKFATSRIVRGWVPSAMIIHVLPETLGGSRYCQASNTASAIPKVSNNGEFKVESERHNHVRRSGKRKGQHGLSPPVFDIEGLPSSSSDMASKRRCCSQHPFAAVPVKSTAPKHEDLVSYPPTLSTRSDADDDVTPVRES